MITQETKLVKTWGGFDLTILKVKSKLTRKNRNSYNKTYKPPRSTSYCYQPVELTDTTTCKLRIHGLLLSLAFAKHKHPLCDFEIPLKSFATQTLLFMTPRTPLKVQIINTFDDKRRQQLLQYQILRFFKEQHRQKT